MPDRGSVRITDQVIEEVDEHQMTITSIQGKNDARPMAASLWEPGPPKPTQPVDVPQPAYKRTQSAVAHGPYSSTGIFPPGGVDALLSASAPVEGLFETDFVPLDGQRDDPHFMDSKESHKTVEDGMEGGPDGDASEADEFEKLRQTREKERADRQKFKLVRSVSGLGPIDPDILLEKLTKTADQQQQEAGPSGTDTPNTHRHSGVPATLHQTDTTL